LHERQGASEGEERREKRERRGREEGGRGGEGRGSRGGRERRERRGGEGEERVLTSFAALIQETEDDFCLIPHHGTPTLRSIFHRG